MREWGLTFDEARIAMNLGGWVEVRSVDGKGNKTPLKGKLMFTTRRAASVRIGGHKYASQVELGRLRVQQQIREAWEAETQAATQENETVPPDIAPRPNKAAAVMNAGAAPSARDTPSLDSAASMFRMFEDIKRFKDHYNKFDTELKQADAEVEQAERLLFDTRQIRNRIAEGREAAAKELRKLPGMLTDMFGLTDIAA